MSICKPCRAQKHERCEHRTCPCQHRENAQILREEIK